MVREGRLSAGDARTTTPVAPVHSIVPSSNGNVTVCHGSFATQFKKASFLTVIFSELACFKICSSLAVLMDEPFVED